MSLRDFNMEDKFYLNQFYDELKKMKELEIIIDEPLRNHTTFRIGGPADYFVSTSNVQIIKNVILLAKQYKVPYFILGNGSDLLFSDTGYREASWPVPP